LQRIDFFAQLLGFADLAAQPGNLFQQFCGCYLIGSCGHRAIRFRRG
jgi:hypothetical protein